MDSTLKIPPDPALEPLPPVRYVDGCPILYGTISEQKAAAEGRPIPDPLADGALAPLPKVDGCPIFFEDDDEGDMGESNPHVISDEIAHVCVKAHLASRPEFQVYSNMNLYYRPRGYVEGQRLPYVSPDVMVVKPFQRLPEDVSSYFLGQDGPAPLSATEILSPRSAQQRDLNDKLPIYSYIGIEEYILVDRTGVFLPEKLLIKRLQGDGTWKDERDADGGVTSRLGFRFIIEADGQLRVVDGASGKKYVRPDEAQAEAEARRQAEERVRQLEAELKKLRGNTPTENQN